MEVTEREYEQLRGYNKGGYYRGNRYDSYDPNEQPQDGYFAFFKLRCLICLVLFLGLVAIDKQLNIRENDKVQQVMAMLDKEEITVEECWGLIENEIQK